MRDAPGARLSLPRVSDWAVAIGLGLALAVVPVAFVPQLYDDFTLIKQSLLLVAAALIVLGLSANGFELRLPRNLAVLLVAWVVVLFVAEFTAVDPRGSVTGVYQYRQGFVTQLAYVAIFAGAAQMTARHGRRWLALMILPGLAGVTLYTFIQATGNDPISWWVDTKDRAIGTIGNANELAGYAVVALVAAAPWAASRDRMAVGAAGVSAAVAFIVFQSESRSGLLALAVFLICIGPAWFIAGRTLRDALRPIGTLGAGMVAGLVLSFAAGGLAGSAGRIEGGIQGQDAGGSTRLSLWEGTLNVIRETPIHGAGPDGLFLLFPQYRPADLKGAFERYDLVAQSSHNYVLDTAANYGVPGLLVLVGLVAASAWRSIERARRSPASDGLPIVWSAVAAYGAMTLLNPISLAAHAVFFAVLGSFAASTTERTGRPTWSPGVRGIAGGAGVVVAAAACVLAVRLPIADSHADSGWTHYDAQEFEAAAREYDRAVTINPFERSYARDLADTYLGAAVAEPEEYLPKAEDAFRDVEARFGLTDGGALALAAVLIAQGQNGAEVSAMIDRALALNPNGLSIRAYADDLRAAMVAGGRLEYSQQDHWTYIVPNAE